MAQLDTIPPLIARRDDPMGIAADETRMYYTIHVEIVVAPSRLDEKRIQQLIDERLESLASHLSCRTP